MLDVEDWAEIRRLRKAEGMPIKAIARVVGCSKNTVKKALAANSPPAYHRPGRGSVVDAVEPRIRELLQATPTMPATVIAERIGWPHSIRVLSARVLRCHRVTFLDRQLSGKDVLGTVLCVQACDSLLDGAG